MVARLLATRPATQWLLLYFILFVVLIINGLERPLTLIHWDGPIHLYQAKRFAETPLAGSYAQHAEAVAAQVDGKWPAGEGYSESYWRFSRFGHIALLGSTVQLFGSDVLAIGAAHWIYLAMMVAALALTAHMTVEFLQLCNAPGSPVTLRWAVVLASAAYSLSFVFSYVGRSLVSEAPALLCLSASAWALIRVVAGGCRFLAVLAGMFAFLAYTVRMESIWVLCALGIALALPRPVSRDWMRLLQAFAIAGVTAFIAYAAYAWIFWPMSDPRLFLIFAKRQPYSPGGISWFPILSSAVGFGWVGLAVSAAAFEWQVTRRVLLWGFVCLLPSIPYVLEGLPVQSRQFTPLMLPVLTASTVGWSYLVQKVVATRQAWGMILAACTVALIAAVSYSSSYRVLKSVAGLWRFSYLRQLLVPPAYEQLSYPYQELRDISRELYREATSTGRAVLVSGAPGQREHLEHLNLIRFFGPSYSPRSDLALVSDPTNPHDCDVRLPDLPEEPVIYCTTISSALIRDLAAQGVPIFHLALKQADDEGLFYLKESARHRDGVPGGAKRTIVREYDHFALELLSVDN